MRKRTLSGCFALMLSVIAASGQPFQKDVRIPPQQSNWTDFTSTLEKENNIRFFYDPSLLPGTPVVVAPDSMLLMEVLRNYFSASGIQVSSDGSGNYFLYRDFKLQTLPGIFFSGSVSSHSPGEKTVTSPSEGATVEKYLSTTRTLTTEAVDIGKKGSSHNNRVILRGKVTAAEEGGPVPLATIKIEELNRYVTSDQSGRYEIALEPRNYTLTVNSLGFLEKSFSINLYSDGDLNITLDTRSILLDEAVISAIRNHNVQSTQMGLDNLTVAAIKKLPVMLGEQDVVKAALMLPGVQSIGEISSGFNVRGSPADQNIFYINGVPVYNATHLFGLFTTFNPDAINGFDLYKSNIPVEYGGRLSSIFNIDAKNGNLKNFSARGGISPVSGRVMVEGPLVKEKASYLASVRTTYSDWLLQKVDNHDISHSTASFYDALMNLFYRINSHSNLSLFLYGSEDLSDIAFGFGNRYANLGGSVRWSYDFNRNLGLNLDLVKSRYAYEEENHEVAYLANRHSFSLNHTEMKLGFRYNLNDRSVLRLGMSSELYGLDHGDLRPMNDESRISPLHFQSEKAMVNSLYAGTLLSLSERLSFEGGVRGAWYSLLGPGTIYDYLEHHPRESTNITDSTHYGINEVISRHRHLDLRLAARFSLLPSLSVKASYNRLHQYLFMLSNTISVSPTNKWKLSDPHLPPMAGEQFSVGLYQNLMQNKLELSIETYYKKVKNLVEYKDGADFLSSRYPETNILQGDLKAYGTEFSIKKKGGKLNGWINYTWSRAEVKALDKNSGEANNRGMAYPANYDRPHAVNTVFNYNLSKRLSLSANAVYSTGRPVTFPTSIYYQNGIQITAFSNRNAYRLPDYFRTDLSVNLEGNLKKNKLAHGSWSFSFYNLTSRKNPYTVIFRNEEGKIKGYEVSILGTIIPSINYNLKFGNYEN